ncbi:MAG: hypothetical protein ABSE45_13810 [Candidatus Acidiferrales bacterium]|jgi:hypothetical protein
MASARAVLERRRSSRIPIRIALKVFSKEAGDDLHGAPAEAISVSRYGALLRVPFLLELGSHIEILHEASHELREFRVISARDQRQDGLFELGVEIYHPARNFWGIQFPGER